MSTILNALRRLEAEKRRQAAEVPLDERVIAPEFVPPPSRVRRLLPWLAGALAALLLLVGGGFLVFGSAPGGEGDAIVRSAEAARTGLPSPPVPTASPSATRAAAPVGAGPAVAVPAPAPAPDRGLATRAVSVSPTRSRSARPSASAVPTSTGSDVRPISMLPEARPRDGLAGEAGTPEAGLDREAGPAALQNAPTMEASGAKARPSSNATAAPARRTGPGMSRSDVARSESTLIPARTRQVSVVKTVWHPNSDRRTARLAVAGESEAREVREGDVVEGYSVREIKLSGVVLERDGVTIERRVGQK